MEYQDKPGHLWYIRYPLADGSGDLVVATTRPETMMGDTGVAVNPEDERFKHLVGKTCILPIMNREIPIVADEYVELGFGTGAVKMTPAHDPNDFEVGLRHNLEVIRCIDDDGKINENGGPYNGMDRYECRKAIVKDLEEQGYLIKTEDYSHNVGTCYRCHNDVEPLISAQWFVKMAPLAKEALRVVNDGEVQVHPRAVHQDLHQLDGERPRLVHLPPALVGPPDPRLDLRRLRPHHRGPQPTPPAAPSAAARTSPGRRTCWTPGSSSALWPFSTLGWPDKTPELDYFYPTSVLVTGYDIIFFWVARMIFSGCEQMGKYPFEKVLIHGLVRDDKGRKMSKSLGNGIDPLEMAEKYGADALRFNLITGNSPGNDMRFYVEKCEAMRNFANKIWNASRFVMMNLTIDQVELPEKLELEDKWVLSKLNTLIREVTENMDAYELGVASAKVYDFIWDTYCDWYIELTKDRMRSADTAENAQNVLCYVLIQVLRLLHPFMPFITEEIYQALPHMAGQEGGFIMTSPWPVWREDLNFRDEEEAMEMVMDAIRAIRGRRAEMNVAPSRKVKLTIATAYHDVFTAGAPFFLRLASAGEVEVIPAAQAGSSDEMRREGMVEVITHAARVFMPLAELVDVEAELERIAKEKAKAEGHLKGIEAKLSNEAFTSKAPAHIVQNQRDQAEKLRSLIAQLDASAAALNK